MKTINRLEQNDSQSWAVLCKSIPQVWRGGGESVSGHDSTREVVLGIVERYSRTFVPRAEFNALQYKYTSLEKRVEFLMQSLCGRGIDKEPSICGGSARIVRTRIPIWTLESYRQLGASEADILQSFPSLTANDLVNAWAYVAANQSEIQSDIASNEID